MNKAQRAGCVILLLTSMATGATTVTVKQLPLGSIVLHSAEDPTFKARLSDLRDLSGDVLLPYAVLLANQSQKTIIGYSVHWTMTDSVGRVSMQALQFCDYKNLSALPSGASTILSMLSGLGKPNVHLPVGILQRYAEIYTAQKDIIVSIDSIIFADGSTAGDDTDKWLRYAMARIKAEKNITAIAAGLTAPELLDAALAPIIHQAVHLPGVQAQNVGGLDAWARHASSDQDIQTALLGSLAMQVLDQSHRVGAAQVVNKLKQMAQTKRYPSL